LPYGCLTTPLKGGVVDRCREGKQTETIIKSEGCTWDIKIDLEAFWKQVKRLRKNKHTPVLMFCNTKFGYDLIQSNPSWFRYDLVWDKGRGVSFLSANKMPMRSHEMIYVFSEVGAYYNRVDELGDFPKGGGGRSNLNVYGSAKGLPNLGTTVAGKRCVKSILAFGAKPLVKGAHPTEKPEKIYRWLIERYCPPGGTILDPTAGSFNSCFTAYEMGRSAIGIEKDDGFFKKASDRLDAL
jgi:site-specific DNA-methyltransferase (adenine-specific)